MMRLRSITSDACDEKHFTRFGSVRSSPQASLVVIAP
ncbi:hypothetical protein PF003_g28224 [Phytophthora fragariae]|nr:hypothetical protein PF003_g28224 [Phytophthora fragariae]